MSGTVQSRRWRIRVGKGKRVWGLGRWQAQDTEGLVSAMLAQRKSMCQGPGVEGSSIWLEQSCRSSRAESRGRSTGLRVMRLGNREPAKGFLAEEGHDQTRAVRKLPYQQWGEVSGYFASFHYFAGTTLLQ